MDSAAAHNQTSADILVHLERRISIAGPGQLWGTREDRARMADRALAGHIELVRLIGSGAAE